MADKMAAVYQLVSARRCGHSNLVIFIHSYSNFHIWIACIKLWFKFEYVFCLANELYIWLYRHNLPFLQAIHNSYNCFGVCDNALNTPSNRRVGKGGVAILWHRSLDNQVSPLDIDSDHICGIQYRVSPNIHYYILQVYAPSSNHPI